MIARRLKDSPAFVSGDKVILRELLHPDKGPFSIRYSLAHAKLARGRTTLPHRLKTSEVYYILKGSGIMHIGRRTRKVGPGTTVYIKPRAVQYIKNTGRMPLEFLCIVDPAWKKADEEILRCSDEKNS